MDNRGNITCMSWSDERMNSGSSEFACTIISFEEDMSLIYMDVLLLKYMIGTGLIVSLLSHFILLATCIHRNSIWNLHATILLIGMFLVLIPSIMFLYLPYQHRLKNVRFKNFAKINSG